MDFLEPQATIEIIRYANLSCTYTIQPFVELSLMAAKAQDGYFAVQSMPAALQFTLALSFSGPFSAGYCSISSPSYLLNIMPYLEIVTKWCLIYNV